MADRAEIKIRRVTHTPNGKWKLCGEEYDYGLFATEKPIDVAKKLIQIVFDDVAISTKAFVYIARKYRGNTNCKDILDVYFKEKDIVMANRAEDLANSLFPDREDIPKGNDFANMERRKRYIQGYHQAEKDLAGEFNASDRGMVDEIIINLKRVESDYKINLTKEMEWLRGVEKKKCKELALTWEDIETITDIWYDLHEDESVWSKLGCDTPEFYKEVLKRFNELRK